jgi:hypothetical protein
MKRKSLKEFIKLLAIKKKTSNAQFLQAKRDQGYKYALNLNTKELHRIDINNHRDSHNLMRANLNNFDFFKETFKASFSSKCAYCFPKVITLGGKVL